MGQSKSNSKRKVYSDTSLLKKQEKSQINNLNFHLRELKKEQTEPKVSRRKERNKVEINETTTTTINNNNRKGQLKDLFKR